jgi:WD40 repeat protein
MALNLQDREEGNELLHIGFNQDFGCFAVGTNTGFRIYNCDPFKETFRRDFTSGGIGVVEMLFRCNILALVGGGEMPRYPPNKVMIWDDHQNRNIGELSFRSPVKAVKLRRDRVVVVLERKIYVYNFHDLKLIDHIDTIQNPYGLCALCPNTNNTILACPGPDRGTVHLELYDVRKNKVLIAHESDLACISLNLDGTRLATASDKGTLIRIFDTSNYTMLQELRSGMDRARILSIAFNAASQYVACSSDHGTVHVWGLKGSNSGGMGNIAAEEAVRRTNEHMNGTNDGNNVDGNSKKSGADENTKSALSYFGSLVPSYFQSEWSFAQFRTNESHTLVAFGPTPNTIIIVGADGSFWKASFEGGGECVQQAYQKFVAEAKDSSGGVEASNLGSSGGGGERATDASATGNSKSSTKKV